MTAVRMRPSVLKELRSALRAHLPASSAGLLNEYIAAGLGFESHQELREQIEDAPEFGLFEAKDFVDRHVDLANKPANDGLLNVAAAITPLYGVSFIPSMPEDPSSAEALPDEWFLVMAAAVNTAIKRGCWILMSTSVIQMRSVRRHSNSIWVA